MKYRIKVFKLMFLKMFTFFRGIFRYSWCRMPQIFPSLKTFIFFVNYSENHRIFSGGSMGKMIGRGIPNILLFILYQRLAIIEAEEI